MGIRGEDGARQAEGQPQAESQEGITVSNHSYRYDWEGLVLRILLDACRKNGEEQEDVWVKYCDLMRAILDLAVGDPNDVNNGAINKARVGVSRAVHRLVKKGYLYGWYRAWMRYGSEHDPMPYLDEGMLWGEHPSTQPRRKPRFVWLQFTRAGIKKLLADEIETPLKSTKGAKR
jgi:hypothetical protein